MSADENGNVRRIKPGESKVRGRRRDPLALPDDKKLDLTFLPEEAEALDAEAAKEPAWGDPSPVRRSTGVTGSARPGRVREMQAEAEARERAADPAASDAEIEERAADSIRDRHGEDKAFVREYERWAQISEAPDRKHVHSEVEQHAMRSTAPGKELDEMLRMATQGRPADRRLVAASFELMLYDKDTTQIRKAYKSFAVDNAARRFAFDDPHVNTSGSKFESVLYSSLHGVVGRMPHTWFDGSSVEMIKVLREQTGDERVGKVWSADGDFLPAARAQRAATSAKHNEAINRGLDCQFFSHGPRKKGRGWKIITLTEQVTGLTGPTVIVPANHREFEYLAPLLVELATLWGPSFPGEVVIADSEYSYHDVHLQAIARAGMAVISPVRGSLSGKYAYAATRGVPACCGDLMKYEQSEPKFGPTARAEGGVWKLEPGQPIDFLHTIRNRWVCANPACPHGEKGRPNRETTYLVENAIMYSTYPLAGDSRKAVQRRAHLRRRNLAETTFDTVEDAGLALGGVRAPAWIQTPYEARVWAKGKLWAENVRRMVHYAGAYDVAEAEFRARGLILVDEPSPAELAKRQRSIVLPPTALESLRRAA